MNRKDLNQKFNYLLLGEEKYTVCPHIVTIETEENGILATDNCGTDKKIKISYEEMIDRVLDTDEGKTIIADILKELAFKNR